MPIVQGQRDQDDDGDEAEQGGDGPAAEPPRA